MLPKKAMITTTTAIIIAMVFLFIIKNHLLSNFDSNLLNLEYLVSIAPTGHNS